MAIRCRSHILTRPATSAAVGQRRTTSSFHHVLALLDHDARSWRSILDSAIGLAEVEQARLTIAGISDPGWIVKWFAPIAAPVTDPYLDALSDELRRAADLVPPSIPVTTVILGAPTGRALRQLTRGAAYDLLVVRDALAAQSRTLWRVIRDLELSVLVIYDGAPSQRDLVSNSFVAPASLHR